MGWWDIAESRRRSHVRASESRFGSFLVDSHGSELWILAKEILIGLGTWRIADDWGWGEKEGGAYRKISKNWLIAKDSYVRGIAYDRRIAITDSTHRSFPVCFLSGWFIFTLPRVRVCHRAVFWHSRCDIFIGRKAPLRKEERDKDRRRVRAVY